MHEIFNKDLEKIKKESVMNNAITEIKSTVEGTNNRITEAEDRISEVKDRTVEINEAERKKRIKRNKDNLRDLWHNVKCPNILSPTSLILSSASVILLLVPSRVLLISFIALFIID